MIYSVSISSNSEYAYAGSASAVGGPSYIYKSSNYGENWTQLQDTNSSTLFPGVIGNWGSVSISGDGIFGIASLNILDNNFNAYSYIYYTKDNGLTWNKSNFNQTDAESWLNQVSISTNGQYGLACSSISSISSSTGNIYYTTDYGVSWTLSSVDIAASWISVSISSDSAYGLACDSPNGYIYYTSNYGANWTKSLSISANWNSVSISSTGQYGLACEYNGNTYFSSTYGQTWVNIKTSNPSTSNPSTTVSISGTGNYGLSCNLNSTSIYNITNTSPSLVDLNQIFAPI